MISLLFCPNQKTTAAETTSFRQQLRCSLIYYWKMSLCSHRWRQSHAETHRQDDRHTHIKIQIPLGISRNNMQTIMQLIPTHSTHVTYETHATQINKMRLNSNNLSEHTHIHRCPCCFVDICIIHSVITKFALWKASSSPSLLHCWLGGYTGDCCLGG